MHSSLRLGPDTPWILSPDEPEPIRRAIEDLRNDWYDVMGHRPLFLDAPPESVDSPVIYLGSHRGHAGLRPAEHRYRFDHRVANSRLAAT